jgi:flagellar hook protein FlgE
MAVVSSLYIGASGLTAHGDAIAVVGDNIANANTVGFKRSRANFSDILASSVGSGSEAGIGSQLDNIQRMLTQGSVLGTGAATDLAINGDGFFVVKGSSGKFNGQFFSRAGQFTVDKGGYVVNADGLRLQGYGADSSGNILKSVGDLSIPTQNMPPIATTVANVVGNLDAETVEPTLPWSATDPNNTSNFSTSVVVYDSLGESHNVTVYFRKEAGTTPGQAAWSWHATMDGGEATGGTAGTPIEAATGTLEFDSQGRLVTESTTSSAFNFNNATQGQAIEFDFGDPLPTGTGMLGLTGYGDASQVSEIRQDGSASGALSNINIGKDGTIMGIFTNGQNRSIGQVVLADFQAAEELQAIGDNLLAQTFDSGEPAIGAASSGGRGGLTAGALEKSNVDLTKEFVDMISFQRGFQANSKTISTADTMLQEVMNLAR